MENKSLFDLKELHAIAAGNDSFITEMIQLFITESAAAMKEVGTCLESGDYVRIRAILHKMKPSIMVMGITTAGEHIRTIEKMDPLNPDTVAFSDICREIDAIITEVNRQLITV
jgi:HPt (histidine-containing phosphotransfer) domain-containing protein